jgi:hypothetical protein
MIVGEREQTIHLFCLMIVIRLRRGGPPEKHAISIFVIRHHPFRPFLTSIPGQENEAVDDFLPFTFFNILKEKTKQTFVLTLGS